MYKVWCIVCITLFLLLNVPSGAQNKSAPPAASVSGTRTENTGIQEQKEYNGKITDLESRIEKLEKAQAAEKSESELENLLKEVQTLKLSSQEQEQTVNRVFRGGERQQAQLNPEISLTGDFFGSYSSSDAAFITETSDFTDGRDQFYLREAEFHIISPLDPFTRGKFFLGIPGTGKVSLSEMIGEAYMEWLNLPGGLNLKVGKYNTQFGILNRWHDHGLPQVDRPHVLTELFGTNNFGGIGIAGNFLLPKLWAHVNELDCEIITGGDGHAFDTKYNNPIGVMHLKNYYDLSRDTYLEIGLSGAYGYNDKKNEYATKLADVDIAYKWVPAARSHYRTTELRGEFIVSQREGAGKDINRYGFYTYIRNKMGPSYWIGLRYGYTQLPMDPVKKNEWDITPSIDFWQSEFVMMRLQYSYTQRSFADNDHAVFLQSVWSMGPHKHEAY
ncbi:hypothetical protein LLG96_19820 [bacterium]|nr:hypothetical protein [bacterium]